MVSTAISFRNEGGAAVAMCRDISDISIQRPDVVWTFDELAVAAAQAKVWPRRPSTTEASPDAPRYAAHLLRRLKALGKAGSRSAVVMLGWRQGVVAADWATGEIWHVTLADSGDQTIAVHPADEVTDAKMLGAMRWLSRNWACAAGLRCPAVSVATRAIRMVAGGGRRLLSSDIETQRL